MRSVNIYGEKYSGKALYDILEVYARKGYYSTDKIEKIKGLDILWYIWAGPNSPVFGKDKMTTFERYFVDDKETYKEVKGAYYVLANEKETCAKILEEFGLDPARKISTFSKGMKRQAFICIALASRCPILLLDEAFDGLDPLVLEKIKDEIISAAEENKTIVISSHNIATLERLCDRFIILHKGKLGKSAETTDLGNSFIKYQILFKRPVTEDVLRAYGANIVTFKMVGSLCNIVTNGELDEEFIKSKLETVLLEQIPIDSTEIVALEMLMVKKNEGGNRHVE